MLTLIFTILSTILLLILGFKLINEYIKKDEISARKNKMKKYFDLKNIKKDIEDFNKKKTLLYFHCEKLISEYYQKLIIFNKEYDLKANKIIEIAFNKFDPFNSDFNENIILKSKNEKIQFIINITYYMNNHYQIILDRIEESLSLEIVLYSKENKFPEKIGNKLILKEYKDNSIPYLKKYNLINISRNDFYKIYNTFCIKKLSEQNKNDLINKNSFLVNFIKKKKNFIGRIFEQKEETEFQDLEKEEVIFLDEIKLLTSNFTKDKKELLNNLKYSIFKKYQKLIENREIIVKKIIEKFYQTCYFNKYYGKEIKKETYELIDLIIFVCYMEVKGISGINFYVDYLDYKNNIFSNEKEFTNFEKLMLIINIQELILKGINFRLLKFYDLPHESPFVQSEKLIIDIFKNLNENSALYFCFLQINSSSGKDFISTDSWFKIKFIPLNKIKDHLINTRYPFFFLYKKDDNKGAFVNPQNLIINFNTSNDVGYNYIKNLELEKNDDNTIRIFLLKLHESSHIKFGCGKGDDSSPRYLLNFELETLDSQYDLITEFKKGAELQTSEKKGEDIGEEGYALEMFLYDSIVKTDYLMKLINDLKEFNNVNLYIQNNFNDLNNMIKNKITNQLIYNEFKKKELKNNEIKARNIKIDKKQKIIEDKGIKKTPLYFFKNYPLEANY